MAKIFVNPSQVLENTIEITDSDDLRHLTKVLRMRAGDKLDISDGEKWEYRCEIQVIEKDVIEAVILDKQAFAREPETEVTLFQGVPKSTKMEGIIQKCVELGVYEIVPVFTERTVVTDNKGNFGKKRDRWQKIADEAVKQCKRGKIPQIEKEVQFREMLEDLKSYDVIVFPYENEENYTIKQCLRKLAEENAEASGKKYGSIALIIGPEGGFADSEAKALVEAGAHCVTLGKTILRTETAGPAALAMIMYELEM